MEFCTLLLPCLDRDTRESSSSSETCRWELQAKLFLGTKFFSHSRMKQLRGRVGGETKSQPVTAVDPPHAKGLRWR